MQDISKNKYWLPFTAIKTFMQRPLLVKEAKGVYYTSDDDRQILDAVSGLWCTNAGHSRPEIAEAIFKQSSSMAYAPSFQLSHPLAFEFAKKLVDLAPADLDQVFFTNSGSEAVDTALKMALGYFKSIGQGSRTRLIGREKGYHGVGFGGLSVGGMLNNRKQFNLMLPGTDHLPHTLDDKIKFNRGLPEGGEEYANHLLKLIELHDPSNIAAVIVEPISASAGVILPPQNYLKTLRKICDDHGILLIFDEVITGFGRIGEAFASTRFGVTPDIITTAKGLTNGAAPMGAVFSKADILNAFIESSKTGVEFFHGYTYSASPIACAAGMAALDIYQTEHLFQRSRKLEDYFEKRIHSLRNAPFVKDIRNFGLIGAIDLESKEGNFGARAYEVFSRAFFEQNLVMRTTGETLAFAPALIIDHSEIDLIFERIGNVLESLK